MREIIEKQWRELAADWRRLYDGNSSLSPFQAYDFLTFTGKGKPYRKDPFRLVGLKELNLALIKDGEPVAIAALLVKKKRKRQLCYIRGHFTAANCVDFVYRPDLSYEDFQFLMDGIKKRLGDVSFQFYRVLEDSLTCRYMREYFSPGQTAADEGAYIPLTQSYESWRGSMHKSARQSLNNHRNRLMRDQVNWSVQYCYGSIDDETYQQALELCVGRMVTKNRFRFGPFAKPAQKLLAFLLRKEKLMRWVHQSKDGFYAILYMNGEIAAFASALICHGRWVCGIRFAISARYVKYSPGGLLISEMVCHLLEQNNAGGQALQRLDMGQGVSGGMSYKSAYGGVIYHLYSFTS